MEFNILTDRLPDSVTADGKKYRIRTDFRRWILMLELLEQCRADAGVRLDMLTAAKCAMHIVMPEYADHCSLPPITLIKLLEEFTCFASGGTLPTETADGKHPPGPQAFDFSCDAGLILSSFLREYGIDLTTGSMHWWKFLALLRSLPSDSDFMRVVRLRLCDTTKIADDEQRKQMRRAKAAVRIRRRNEQ